MSSRHLGPSRVPARRDDEPSSGDGLSWIDRGPESPDPILDEDDDAPRGLRGLTSRRGSAAGRDSAGRGSAGRDSAGRDSAGRGSAGRGSAGRGSAGQGSAGRSAPGPRRDRSRGATGDPGPRSGRGSARAGRAESRAEQRPVRAEQLPMPVGQDWTEDGRINSGKHRASVADARLFLDLRVVGMVLQRELMKFWRSKTRIASGFAQPLLFLLIFGFGMQSIVKGNSGVNFAAYVFPGVIAMSVLGRSLGSAVSIVYDGENGFLREMLVAPASRASIVVGVMFGGSVTAMLQATLLFLAAPVVGAHPSPLGILGAWFAGLLMAAQITALGVAGATVINKPQSFQAITQTVMYPMLVLSGSLIPLKGLPEWLQTIAKFNPFTYSVDALRRLFLETGGGDPILKLLSGIELFGHKLSVVEELGITAVLTVLFAAIGAKNFAKIQ